MASPTIGVLRVLLEGQKCVEKILKQKGLVTEDELIAIQKEVHHDFEPILKIVAEELDELKPWISMDAAMQVAKTILKENPQ